MSILSAVQLVSEKMGVTVKANNLTDHDYAFKSVNNKGIRPYWNRVRSSRGGLIL